MNLSRLKYFKNIIKILNLAFLFALAFVLTSCGGNQSAQEALKKGVFRVDEQIALYPEVVIDGPPPIDDETDTGDVSDGTDVADGADGGTDSTDVGTDDGSDDSTDVGTDDGSDDSTDVGTDDGSGDSTDVGTDDGSDDSTDVGTDDGSDDSTDVGTDDGSDDSTDVGTDDGSDDSTDVGTDDGSDDSTDVGTDDGSDDSTDIGTDGGAGDDDGIDNGGEDSCDDDAGDGSTTDGDDGVEDQVTICHIPPGEPDNKHTITVGESAVSAHLAHGDYLGECLPDPVENAYLPIVRACWDRPVDYPTVNRANEKAIFSYLDSHEDRFGFRELTGADFYRQIPEIPFNQYEEDNAKQALFCQANSSDECWSEERRWQDLPPGLIIKMKFKYVQRGPRRVIDRTYVGVSTADMKYVSDKDPIQVIVENIGQYEGNQKTQIKKDYCDIVYRDSSPILLDFSGRGYLLHKQSEGPLFDMDADGNAAENVSWTGLDAAFLVLDLNHNGQIDSSREMFGTKTQLTDGSDAANGFIGLAQYDDNGDSLIDENDGIFNSLELWVDANQDGYTDPGELKSLSESGVKALNLGYISTQEFDIFGNEAREKSTFEDVNGNHHLMVDIYFMTIENVK